MSKSLFFQIFKVTWWPWTKVKVIGHRMFLKVLPQTTFGPSLVILVLLVSEILSMFKFRDGRTDCRTDGRTDGRTPEGHFIDSLHFTREPKNLLTKWRISDETFFFFFSARTSFFSDEVIISSGEALVFLLRFSDKTIILGWIFISFSDETIYFFWWSYLFFWWNQLFFWWNHLFFWQNHTFWLGRFSDQTIFSSARTIFFSGQ